MHRFVNAGAVALALGLACVALRGEQADACGWSGPTAEDLTTFDPQIADDLDGLAYDPYVSGWGGPCHGCVDEAMKEDWSGYLGAAVEIDDWMAVLRGASSAELTAIGEVLAGKRHAVAPEPFRASSLWKDAAARPKLRAAVELTRLARQVEALAEAAGEERRGAAASGTAAQPARRGDLVELARAGMKAARQPFLAQRYGFQMVRALFYQRRWSEVIEAVDQQATPLAGPSQDLLWRARYYAAGALMRSGQRARGNLELARIHAGYAPLAGGAANDFRPMEDSDWRESLRLARTVSEKVALWRLVGVTRDGLTAMREIVKLDATSPLLAVLMVREVEKAEGRTSDPWSWQALDAKAQAAREEAQRREYAALEQVAVQVAAAPRADRPWLMTLVAGHLAAKRGELATAKQRLLAAASARPADLRVQNQVHASLAMALVIDAARAGSAGKPALRAPAPERANAIAEEMMKVSEKFGRAARLRAEVRGKLAAAYLAAGKLIEAELLQPGLLEGQPSTAGKWQDPSFLKGMIARAGQQSSAFDRFLTSGSYTPGHLEQELAMRYLTSGAFGEAARLLARDPTSPRLGTDPFVMRLVDCHDCDHAQYAEAPWTMASFAARLVQLERAARGKGEPAATAALQLGHALYNITWYGNARVVLEDTHQTSRAPRAAERWYKRAFELSRDRELRARAAFFAAKAELGSLITAAEQAAGMSDEAHLGLSDLPMPRTWFSVMETFSDTAYYREVLAECSNFSRWTQQAR